jgi:hypothetical protein
MRVERCLASFRRWALERRRAPVLVCEWAVGGVLVVLVRNCAGGDGVALFGGRDGVRCPAVGDGVGVPVMFRGAGVRRALRVALSDLMALAAAEGCSDLQGGSGGCGPPPREIGDGELWRKGSGAVGVKRHCQ